LARVRQFAHHIGNFMLTGDCFERLAADLAAANGLSVELARTYTAWIGDTPELDDKGKLVVRDENEVVLARLLVPTQVDFALKDEAPALRP
jgi:hypothetical protein